GDARAPLKPDASRRHGRRAGAYAGLFVQRDAFHTALQQVPRDGKPRDSSAEDGHVTSFQQEDLPNEVEEGDCSLAENDIGQPFTDRKSVESGKGGERAG